VVDEIDELVIEVSDTRSVPTSAASPRSGR
jgi:hypothetical protein